MRNIPLLAIVLTLVWSWIPTDVARAELTVQVGGAPVPPVTLIDHTDNWRYRRGTNQPPADWHTMADAALDASWGTGPGGFGFGDGDDATILSDMQGNYTTVYIRQTFEVVTAVDSASLLRLLMDWDDGFVAYLDGVEVARSSNMGVPGSPVPFTITANPDHPAVVDGGSVEVFELGAAGSRLQAGTHVLALIGANGDLPSSDVTLIGDLVVQETGLGGSLADGLFSLVTVDNVELSGTNTAPASTKVIVNGDEGAFNLTSREWSKTQMLSPGMNRFFIAAVDINGAIVESTELDLVYQTASVSVSGFLSTDTTWDPSNGTVRVTGTVEVDSGATLTINPGTVVLMSPGASIFARAGSAVSAVGTEAAPVFFLPVGGSAPWGELTPDGAGSSMTLRYAEVAAGQVRVENGGTLLVEDCVLRDMTARQMVEADQGAQLTIRRTHFNRYSQVHLDFTPLLLEGNLIENISSDATDFEGANFDMVIRRNTYRFGAGGNTDAIDLDNCVGLLVEGCLIHDVGDKGISIGDNCDDTVVRNNLVYNAASGISAYASDRIVVHQNTVFNCDFGLRLYDRSGHPGPAFGSATNNILWANTESLSVTDGSTLEIQHSDVSGTGVPAGIGNINLDPLFEDALSGDFRLGSGSPAVGAGLGGVDMGVIFPVGGIPAAPFNLAANGVATNEVRLDWEEDAENEDGFLVLRSADGATWTPVANLPPNSTSYTDTGLEVTTQYQYRVRSTNSMGNSRLSNLTKGTTTAPPVTQTMVSGPILADTTWSPQMGTIIVSGNVTVAPGATLTVAPGTLIRVGPGLSIRGTGGNIDIIGTEENKVVMERSNPANDWDEITVSGAGSSMTIRHADISGGEVGWLTATVGLMEDTYVHHYSPGGSRIVNSVSATMVTLRRCRISHYHETLFRLTLTVVEECLFELAINPSSDAIDFDSAPAGSTIRRSTFRNGLQSNTDAIDLGPLGSVNTIGTLIEDCVMHDFTDKGVSIGDGTRNNGATLGAIIRNCLIYNTTVGIQVKGESDATVHNTVLVDIQMGLHGFEKDAGTGGGIFTNTYNNILHEVATVIELEGAPRPSYIQVNYSDTHGTNWPGTGNINLDPMFRSPADRDYRLASGSPCIGTGMGGVDMGITYPVGGTPAHPLNLTIDSVETGQVSVSWEDGSDNETGFVLQHSTDGTVWTELGEALRDTTNLVVTGSFNTELVHRFRLYGTNFIGRSLYSDVATTSLTPDDFDDDGMPNDWELANGLDPNDPSDASGDPDLDGSVNRHEYQAGTDPNDPGSVLKITSIRLPSENQVELKFPADANRTYSILYRDSLSSGTWLRLVDVPSETFAREFTANDFIFGVVNTRYYQLVTPAQP